jgi:hypothetical protein
VNHTTPRRVLVVGAGSTARFTLPSRRLRLPTESLARVGASMSVLTETYTLRNVGLTPTPFDEQLLLRFSSIKHLFKFISHFIHRI